MLIKVEQRDIEQGERECSDRCAVALAIKRETGFNSVEVEGDHAVLRDNHPGFLSRTVIVDLPRSAQRFIRRFDKGMDVEPFSFILREK